MISRNLFLSSIALELLSLSIFLDMLNLAISTKLLFPSQYSAEDPKFQQLGETPSCFYCQLLSTKSEPIFDLLTYLDQPYCSL